MIATDRWKTFAAAALTVALLVLAATLASAWRSGPLFIEGSRFTRGLVLEAGGTAGTRSRAYSPRRASAGSRWLRLFHSNGCDFRARHRRDPACGVSAASQPSRARAAGILAALALHALQPRRRPHGTRARHRLLGQPRAFSRTFAVGEETLLAAFSRLPLIARTFAEAASIPLTVPILLRPLSCFCCAVRRMEPTLPCFGFFRSV